MRQEPGVGSTMKASELAVCSDATGPVPADPVPADPVAVAGCSEPAGPLAVADCSDAAGPVPVADPVPVAGPVLPARWPSQLDLACCTGSRTGLSRPCGPRGRGMAFLRPPLSVRISPGRQRAVTGLRWIAGGAAAGPVLSAAPAAGTRGLAG